jgi:hypothetical protein
MPSNQGPIPPEKAISRPGTTRKAYLQKEARAPAHQHHLFLSLLLLSPVPGFLPPVRATFHHGKNERFVGRTMSIMDGLSPPVQDLLTSQFSAQALLGNPMYSSTSMMLEGRSGLGVQVVRGCQSNADINIPCSPLIGLS